MKGNVSLIGADHQVEWNQFFERLPVELQDIHYSFAYNNLYEKNGDGKITLFVYDEGDVFFFYPFLIRQVPGHAEFQDIETVYGYTGPLVSGSKDGFIARANTAFLHYCKEQKVISEFIRFNPLLQNQLMFSDTPGVSLVKLRDYIAIDLHPSMQKIESAYTSQNRNKIRKAEKAGVTIEWDAKASNFNAFTEIYISNMKRLQASGMYFFSDKFYVVLKQLVLDSGMLINAKFNNEIVGSTAFLKGGKYGHYFLSSTTEEGRKLAVGNLMLNEGVKWCKMQKLERMHLGGGLTDDPKDPLLAFKMNFSTETVPFYIGKRIHDAEGYALVIAEWEKANPELAVTQKVILQRYRLAPAAHS